MPFVVAVAVSRQKKGQKMGGNNLIDECRKCNVLDVNICKQCIEFFDEQERKERAKKSKKKEQENDRNH
jgi:hypothetical protein